MRVALLLIGLLVSHMAASSEELLWQPETAIVPTEVIEAEQRYQQYPDSLNLGADLINHYLSRVRRSDNHEYLQKAKQLRSMLAEKTSADKNVDWLLASADLMQYQHEFNKASEYLERILELRPFHLQASLMQARIALARGEQAAAKSLCTSLFGQHSLSVVSTCLLEVEGRGDRPLAAYKQLTELQKRQPNDTEVDAIERWRLQILAEQALLLERYAEARSWLNQLPEDTTIVEEKLLLDSYLLETSGSLPNSLIADCNSQLIDALAVRVALVQQRLHDGGCWVDYIKQRMHLRVLRNDRLHSADIAFYFTYLVQQPESAVKWANINYSVAKEPFDKQLLIDAQQLQKEVNQ